MSKTVPPSLSQGQQYRTTFGNCPGISATEHPRLACGAALRHIMLYEDAVHAPPGVVFGEGSHAGTAVAATGHAQSLLPSNVTACAATVDCTGPGPAHPNADISSAALAISKTIVGFAFVRIAQPPRQVSTHQNVSPTCHWFQTGTPKLHDGPK